MKRGQPIFVVSGLNLLNEQKSYVSEVAYQDKKIFIPISLSKPLKMLHIPYNTS